MVELLQIDSDRLHACIDKHAASNCWLWTGAVGRCKYGIRKIRGKSYLVHRLFYQMYKGEIQDGLQVDHLCNVRICMNPEHMRLVTAKENLLARHSNTVTRFNKEKTHCHNGHEYTKENTRINKNKANGARVCKTCNQLYQRAYYKTHKYMWRSL